MGSWCPEGRQGEGESLGWAPASWRLSGEQRFADGIFAHELLCRCVGLSRERELGLPGVKASLGACVWRTVCRGFSGQPGKPRQVQSKRHVLQEGEQRVCGDGHSPPTPPGPAQHRQLRLLLGSWTEWGPPGPAEPSRGCRAPAGADKDSDIRAVTSQAGPPNRAKGGAGSLLSHHEVQSPEQGDGQACPT